MFVVNQSFHCFVATYIHKLWMNNAAVTHSATIPSNATQGNFWELQCQSTCQLLYFSMSVPLVSTLSVQGGRPLFRAGLKPGIFPKLKSPQASMLGISTALCPSTAPYVSYSYTTTTPLAPLNTGIYNWKCPQKCLLFDRHSQMFPH